MAAELLRRDRRRRGLPRGGRAVNPSKFNVNIILSIEIFETHSKNPDHGGSCVGTSFPSGPYLSPLSSTKKKSTAIGSDFDVGLLTALVLS